VTAGVLALGGNLGPRRATLQRAVDGLPAHGVTPVRSSSVYATAAVGGPPDQPAYLNACVAIETAHAPLALLEACKAIERALGRAEPGAPGYVHHGPRPADLDILLLGDTPFEHERLTIPHAAMAERRFVLIPLLELDLGATLPDGTRLADALAVLPFDEDVRRDGPPLRL
jgi:2-amino-4-hydroxy-6-hydroxymethyldihydropteridine diphosphokinase